MARKILLADDSVTAQNMGRKILADAGYEVLTVNNGSAALKRINEVKPDLIVLDVYMPGYSGLEVCQRLKEAAETAHIPVLLTVGKLEPFKPDEARRVRADAHIVKPFEASELLSALARLEDRIVPHSEGSRFSAGVERFAGDGDLTTETPDFDSGWKSRLRFPSKKKKKEEPEAEPDDTSANFRDFRKGKGKASRPAAAAGSAPEPAVVPDIPRDITPEELDALSALAAKLDGPGSEADKIAALAKKDGPPEPAVVTAAATPGEEAPAAAKEVPALAAEPVAEHAATAPTTPEATVAETTVAAMSTEPVKEFDVPAAPAAMIPATTVEDAVVAENVVEIPVEHVEPTPAAVAAIEQPAPTEPSQTAEAPALALVNAASFADVPAPVDRQDEPMFASAAAEEKIETMPAEAVASREVSAPVAQAVVKAEEPAADAPSASDGKAEELSTQQPKLTEPRAAETAPAAASTAEPVVEAEARAPSDEELAAALRLLTPSTAQSEVPVPSQGTLVAAGQLLAEEAARHASANLRWIAEPVALSPEEASLSLEEEMFRTFAAMPAAEPATAAVESRPEDASGSEPAAVTSVGEEQPGPEKVSAAENKPFEVTPTGVAGELVAAAETAPIAVQKDSSAMPAEEAPEELPRSATFADAVAQVAAGQFTEAKFESEAAADAPVAEEPAPAAAGEYQNSSSESGGQEDMAKDGKGKWHQIHTPASAAAKSDAVEASKQAEPAAGEVPKAMAAAASAENAAASAPTPDPSAIASIVDSVLSDLRPKIVEEIAKKLAGK